MNYYMNIAAFYKSDRGRKLYQEIGMIEEQHVTQYGALLDTKCTWLESLLMHEYTECYLYWSCFNDETDRPVKKIWEQHFHQELSHLHAAARLLQTYEKKEWRQVIPDGEFWPAQWNGRRTARNSPTCARCPQTSASSITSAL